MINANKVLVTGTNGYIAMWVIRHLLDEGYFVRGTVAKQKSLLSPTTLKSKSIHLSNKRFTLVKAHYLVCGNDISCEEWNTQPSGVSFITVKRIILTPFVSTVARVSLEQGDGIKQGGQTEEPAFSSTINENDWNKESVLLSRLLGEKAPPLDKYAAGKITAEQGGLPSAQL
ncbi:hypothetical protein AN958_11058 [Leucoagaricus sp. SymC.cos]|nr:hypothetical protein AN958_11058 [Leucoagaricus sp. SymC.cos]